MLSIKGNFISDEGVVYLSQALNNNKFLQEIDISFNEIGLAGFNEIISVLPNCSLISLLCNRNPLGDECLIRLSEHLMSQSCKLKRLELCTCKLNDKGLASLLKALQTNKLLS